MDIKIILKIILKSLVLGGLLALAAIVTEFLFFFYDDGVMGIDPGPMSLFVLQALFFFGIVLLLSLQFRLMSGDSTPKKFNAGMLLQFILLMMYFLFIIIKPVFLYGLTMISGALIVIGAVTGFLKKDKKDLLQAGVYAFLTCLGLLITMTTYITVIEG